MTMNSKVSSKLASLALNPSQMIDKDTCGKIKGGAAYYCCTRNRWITY